MTTKLTTATRIARPLAIAGATLGILLAAGAAHAGSCPAGQITTNGQQPGPTAHKGVAEKVLSSIPLAKEKVGLKDYALRMRRLIVQPGGIVAWHSHADRPANIYVVSGSIVEYSSHCAVPIVHNTGDVASESGGLSHWWKNLSKKPVVLLSADLLHDHDDHNM